jgi:hypothetical protein
MKDAAVERACNAKGPVVRRPFLFLSENCELGMGFYCLATGYFGLGGIGV